jgi:hypothetical protein
MPTARRHYPTTTDPNPFRIHSKLNKDQIAKTEFMLFPWNDCGALEYIIYCVEVLPFAGKGTEKLTDEYERRWDLWHRLAWLNPPDIRR